MGKFVDLLLEKDGERQTIHMNTGSTWDMAKKAKKLAGLNRKGWMLVSCSGNDAAKVEMFNKVAQGYVPGMKEAAQFAGVKGVPDRVKKLWKKDKAADGAQEPSSS